MRKGRKNPKCEKASREGALEGGGDLQWKKTVSLRKP
jgi:hypothetical protein